MNKYDQIYQQLRKTLSDAEIVEGYVFPDDLTEAERAAAEEEFRKLRLQSIRDRTEEQRVLSELMRMKLLIKDYLESAEFEETYSFSRQLAQYIHLLGRSHKHFADEIDLHPTKLSRLLNDRENPNVELAYRLESHCGHVIPALYWWKLYAKKIEEDVKNDQVSRKVESEKVKNGLRFRA